MKKRPPLSRLCGTLLCGFFLTAFLLSFSGCSDFFTTSLGKPLAQSKNFSSLSFSELVDAAGEYGAKDSDAAKSIMNNLASASSDKLLGLSTSDKTAILNTAVNAAYSLDSLLDLVDDLKNTSTSSSDTIDKAFEFFNTGTNMNAAQTLLDDENTRNNVPVDTLILSAAALMASVQESDIDSIKIAVENKNPSALSGDVQKKAQTVIAVVETLETREAEIKELTDSFGFDLSDLLPGYGN